MIRIKDLTKLYTNGIVALDHINLQIEKNEFVYLVGASGAGKSTLLNMIYRAETPSSGEIYIDNFLLSKLGASDIPYLRRNIGVIFQDFKLLPLRTVFENVSFALRFLSYSRSKIRRQTIQVLELVGLQHKMDHLCSELSGGEQQRICIARAIVNNPHILLADEPTGSLDPNNTSIILDEMLSFAKEFNIAMLIVTHNHNFINKFDVTYTMNDLNKIVL